MSCWMGIQFVVDVMMGGDTVVDVMLGIVWGYSSDISLKYCV